MLGALLGCAAEPEPSTSIPGAAPPAGAAVVQAPALVGQLLLPGEGGRRGIELHAWVSASDGEEHQLWILPESDGRFVREFSGELLRVSLVAGSEVQRFDAANLPAADEAGRIDLGAIDLRERLVPYRVRVRPAEGSPGGAFRAGLSIGPWRRSPFGELPSLGSIQFPTRELGSEAEWLLPPEMDAIHFLVERPEGPGSASNWRTGKQQLFGPHSAAEFPLELLLD